MTEGTPEKFNPHARMRELDEQFYDSYCIECARNCKSIIVCGSCGEQPKAEDIDMSYCRYCNEHTSFINVCPHCGNEIKTI